nr:T9SS type B sorting domain-containing protein [uncultured Flavobacterium sp.]
MKKTLLLITFLSISLGSYAQGEANIWYFGNKAGLDFNSGNPVALTDGKLVTLEGCATISNAAGQLLFYTDGITVWNKNHQIMPNGTGLSGHYSSTQSAVIVPKPNDPNIYYIFTVTELAYPDGVRYSEVDLSLNGGLGDVTSNKNIQLLTPACEKISAVKNGSGDGYWVVFHAYGNNNFYSYSVTSLGINMTPVISSVGTAIVPFFNSTSRDNTAGYLKFSPDGTKLICANLSVNVELFDFDVNTGLISNAREVIYNNYGTDVLYMSNYGVEFSPSGKIAYLTKGAWLDTNELFQYDLTAADIPSTETRIYLATDYRDNLGALQIAPDGKIYGCYTNSDFLFSINNPDVLGTGCNFILKAVTFNAGQKALFGLPTFIQSYFLTTIDVENNCVGQTSSFSLTGNQQITTTFWDFGDGNTSTDVNPTHVYASPGTFTISVTATSATGTSTKTKDIVISAVPTSTQPQNILVCDSNNDGIVTFNLSSQNATILNGQDSNLYGVNYLVNNVAIANPNAYSNTVPYQQEIITVEVYNRANISCKSTTTFNIDVFDSSKPGATIPKLTVCDNTSVGTDVDGRVIFDLTQRATAILKGQSATQFTLSYYKDMALTQNIAMPTVYQNTNHTETIYVKMVNKDHINCFATTTFQIEVLALPVITGTVTLKQCDDNIDGFSVFNLEEAIAKITTNAATETITFYKTPLEAQNNSNPIITPTTYTNQVVSNDAVYVRVANSNNCFRIAQLNLTVSTTQIPLNFAKSFTVCDDAILGTNTDGIATFDFSSATNDIQALFPPGQVLDISYYTKQSDALAEKNAITAISNYRNSGYPNTQNIYVRVDSRLNNDCLGLGSHITLNVEKIPVVTSQELKHCDDNQDGFFAFDTTTLQTNLLNGLTNVTVTYLDQNNVSLPSPLPNPFNTASQTLQAVVTNNTPNGCSFETTIKFVVDDLPEAFPVATTAATTCDDEANPIQQDGKYAFDTTTFQNTILGTQTGMIVKYFDKNNNPLPSPLPNLFVTATQNVRVEVINPINTACNATTTIAFTVNPVPKISLLGDELVCSNLPTFTKVLDAGILDATPIGNYSYTWSFNGNPIAGATNYTLTVNTAGLYTVKVTNTQGCSRTRTLTVVASDSAKITGVSIVDLAVTNSISVTVTGTGNYVYGLDDEYGVYQIENIFNNVTAGIHTVFVKDLNGCGITPKEVSVLGIPNFFTPNSDGYNDTWNIKGINTSFNAKSTIYIFNRYGKLVKQLSPMGEGWNGLFNGQLMPADDYWYSIELEDGRVMKGHFALKR